jgi:hypothetical protein
MMNHDHLNIANDDVCNDCLNGGVHHDGTQCMDEPNKCSNGHIMHHDDVTYNCTFVCANGGE